MVNGSPVPYLVRLNADGSRDASYRMSGSGLDGPVKAVKVQPDGRALVGGDFTSYAGQPVGPLVRLAGDPRAVPQPGALAFPKQPVNTSSKPMVVVVGNEGTSDLVFPQGALSFAGVHPKQFLVSKDTCSGKAVAPGGACTVAVRLRPTSKGSKSATLRIASNSATRPDTIGLTGYGLVRPGPVHGLKVSVRSLRVRWKASPGAQGYRVRAVGRRPQGRPARMIKVTSNESLELKQRLLRTSPLRICVWAFNDAGTSPKTCRSLTRR